MKLNSITKRYPNDYVVLCPQRRSDKSGYVTSWKVLSSARQFAKAKDLVEYYKGEGISGVCMISTGGLEDGELVEDEEFMAGYSAEFFRVYFGMS